MGWMFRGRSIGLSQAVGVPSCEVTDTDSAADQPEAAAAPRRSGPVMIGASVSPEPDSHVSRHEHQDRPHRPRIPGGGSDRDRGHRDNSGQYLGGRAHRSVPGSALHCSPLVRLYIGLGRVSLGRPTSLCRPTLCDRARWRTRASAPHGEPAITARLGGPDVSAAGARFARAAWPLV